MPIVNLRRANPAVSPITIFLHCWGRQARLLLLIAVHTF
jgi:hypothetical protein